MGQIVQAISIGSGSTFLGERSGSRVLMDRSDGAHGGSVVGLGHRESGTAIDVVQVRGVVRSLGEGGVQRFRAVVAGLVGSFVMARDVLLVVVPSVAFESVRRRVETGGLFPLEDLQKVIDEIIGDSSSDVLADELEKENSIRSEIIVNESTEISGSHILQLKHVSQNGFRKCYSHLCRTC